MKQALELAEKGRGKTSPNPLVGAVIVKNDRVVGEGFHARAGGLHAEINALRAAGAKAQGGTLCTTLEPCSVYGKTPPCTEAIIASGISRLIVGLVDPNPKVNGEGISILKKAGIEVEVGFLEDKITRQNEAYLKYITTGEPFVLLKVAMSLDGKITSRNIQNNLNNQDEQKWITGTEARDLVHRIRDEYDAVAVGIGTVLADDPLLTVRLENEATKNPLRVIVDSAGRLPESSKIVRTAAKVPTVLATTSKISPTKTESLKKAGVEIWILPASQGKVNLKKLLKKLGNQGITSLLLEGGAGLNNSFIKANLVDKYLFFVAPKILGPNCLSLIGGENSGGEKPPDISLTIAEVKKVGEDLAITCYPKKEDLIAHPLNANPKSRKNHLKSKTNFSKERLLERAP